jgi:hypothetical protein
MKSSAELRSLFFLPGPCYQGEKAKAIARAATAAGVRRAYVLQGGFNAWSAAGLGIRPGSDYGDSPVVGLLADAAETVSASAASVVPKGPVAVVAAGAAVGVVALAAFNVHLLLEWIGVLGLELTLLYRLSQYDSLDDLLADISGLAAKGKELTAGPAAAVGSALATSKREDGPEEDDAVGSSSQ